MDLKTLSEKVSGAFLARARDMRRASRFVRAALLVFGASLAGVAQFAEFEPTGATAWQITGILATVIVGIGALFSAIVDEDASEGLALARQAVEQARSSEDRYSELANINNEFEKAVELYQIMSLGRGVLEQSTMLPAATEALLITTILAACRRSLPIAMGFAQADRWTVCIYKAETDASGLVSLVCLAHARAIDCELSEARKWAAGTGVAGSAFSNKGEVIIDDLQLPGLQSVFGTAANIQKPGDPDIYQSMAAVPVMVAGSVEPWGVVTATNDRVGHFSAISNGAIDASEAVRALSSLVALAVACFNQPSRITAPT